MSLRETVRGRLHRCVDGSWGLRGGGGVSGQSTWRAVVGLVDRRLEDGRRHCRGVRLPEQSASGTSSSVRRRIAAATIVRRGRHGRHEQFKNGMHIELDGKVWRIVEFQHVKPGKGGAFVRTKLKASTRAPSSTARSAPARSSRASTPRRRTSSTSTTTAPTCTSWTPRRTSSSRCRTPSSTDELPFMQPNATVQVLGVNGKPSSVQLPTSVELAVVETEPGVKGDTVSNVTKPATLETGAVVQVPLFVNVGDSSRSTRTRALHLARLTPDASGPRRRSMSQRRREARGTRATIVRTAAAARSPAATVPTVTAAAASRRTARMERRAKRLLAAAEERHVGRDDQDPVHARPASRWLHGRSARRGLTRRCRPARRTRRG